jgi:tripartite motif-containing protein 2/3
MKNFEHLDILVNEAKNKLKYCQEQYTTLDGHLADLQEQLESSRGNIDETYQSYKAILEKRRVNSK